MSFDGILEGDRALERARTLAGGRVYDSVPEETQLARDSDGQVLPYIIMTVGTPFAAVGDRTIMGETEQPQNLIIIFECWAASADTARRLAGGVRRKFLGHQLSDNSTQIQLGGGGYFQTKSATGRPSRYSQSVTCSMIINQSIDND